MQTCDPLEHPSPSVRRNNIVRFARLGGIPSSQLSALTLPLATKEMLLTLTSSPGGDAELQQLARAARSDADASCRAAAVGAMVAIRSVLCAVCACGVCLCVRVHVYVCV